MMEENRTREAEELTPIKLREDVQELSLSIERMRAVAESFAGDYIDVSNPAQAVAMRPEHFANLYSALFCMIVDIDEKAETLNREAEALYKSTMQKGAGASALD
jgi:hypothetical protein